MTSHRWRADRWDELVDDFDGGGGGRAGRGGVVLNCSVTAGRSPSRHGTPTRRLTAWGSQRHRRQQESGAVWDTCSKRAEKGARPSAFGSTCTPTHSPSQLDTSLPFSPLSSPQRPRSARTPSPDRRSSACSARDAGREWELHIEKAARTIRLAELTTIRTAALLAHRSRQRDHLLSEADAETDAFDAFLAGIDGDSVGASSNVPRMGSELVASSCPADQPAAAAEADPFDEFLAGIDESEPQSNAPDPELAEASSNLVARVRSPPTPARVGGEVTRTHAQHQYSTGASAAGDASALVGRTMIALKAPPIRAQIGLSSARRGNLTKDDRFVVLEAGEEVGVTRLRMQKGWVSAASRTGEPIIVERPQPATVEVVTVRPAPEPPVHEQRAEAAQALLRFYRRVEPTSANEVRSSPRTSDHPDTFDTPDSTGSNHSLCPGRSEFSIAAY